MTTTAQPGRILGVADVLRETSLSESTLYRRIKDDSFPKPIPLGGRRKGWPESAINEWKARCIAAAS